MDYELKGRIEDLIDRIGCVAVVADEIRLLVADAWSEGMNHGYSVALYDERVGGGDMP